MNAITVSDLGKSYDSLSVLDGLSFDVEDGAVFGLLGPNGAGKTTTIDILTGVSDSDSGTVRVLDIDPGEDPIKVRDNVGILPEKESPPSFQTPREYFAFIGDVRGIESETITERTQEWATRLEFEDKLDVYCKDLSRGQQQKVMLVQALIHQPELVFIDEPLANLDPVMQERVKEFIREYHDAGNTIVLSTHHVEVAQELCTRVGILTEGQFSTDFDPRNLSDEESVRELYLETMNAGKNDGNSTNV